MRPFILTCLAALTTAGCGSPTAPPSAADAARTEAPPPAPPRPPGGPTVPSAPPAAPSVLQPIVRGDWQDRLEPGAGCTLSRDGVDYVIVVVGDGVAKVGGRVVDLTGVPTTFDTMTAPGRYAGAGTVISLTSAPDLGEGDAVDETFTRPVRVEVTSGGQTERFEAAWTCGA